MSAHIQYVKHLQYNYLHSGKCLTRGLLARRTEGKHWWCSSLVHISSSLNVRVRASSVRRGRVKNSTDAFCCEETPGSAPLLLRERVEAVLAARVFLPEVLMNELQLRHQMKAHLQVHLQVLQPRLQLHKRRPAAESRHTSISTGSLFYCFSFVKTTVIA